SFAVSWPLLRPADNRHYGNRRSWAPWRRGDLGDLRRRRDLRVAAIAHHLKPERVDEPVLGAHWPIGEAVLYHCGPELRVLPLSAWIGAHGGKPDQRAVG